MSEGTFTAIRAHKTETGQEIRLERITTDDLPDGDVTIAVEYSSLNYKDGLALKGQGRILRTFPMSPGIDLAGTVRSSENPDFAPGDPVVLTGWGVGETWSGGFSQMARARSAWLVKLPEGLSTRTAMVIGTAGFTAMLCVQALERHGIKAGGEVVVSGAAGGVGSVAVRLLARLGYRPVALTGRMAEAPYLTQLGATEVLDRAEFAMPGKPLQSERWAGAVDTVGGQILANILASTSYGGAVAACGLAASAELPTTVFPFILRNVALLGVDSAACPLPERIAAWQRLAALLDEADFEALTREVGLADVPALADEILNGQVRGRVIVRLERERDE